MSREVIIFGAFVVGWAAASIAGAVVFSAITIRANASLLSTFRAEVRRVMRLHSLLAGQLSRLQKLKEKVDAIERRLPAE